MPARENFANKKELAYMNTGSNINSERPVTFATINMLIYRLLKLAGFNKLIIPLLSGLIATLSAIALIGVSAKLIAQAALQPPLATLTIAVTGVRACGVARAVFRYLDRYFSHKLAFTCYERLQLSAYKQATLQIPLKEGNAREGELMHDLLTGTMVLRNFYLRVLPQPVILFLITTVCSAVIFSLSPVLALILPINYLLHLLIPPIVLHKSRSANRLQRSSIAYRVSIMDLVLGRTELATAGTIDQANNQLNSSSQEYQQANLNQENNLSRLLSLLDMIRLLSWTIGIILLIPCVTSGTLTGIEYAVWVLLLESIIAELRFLPKSAIGLIDAVIAGKGLSINNSDLVTPVLVNKLNSITSLRDMPAIALDNTNATSAGYTDEPLLTIENISFSYDNQNKIIDNLSFLLAQGQHTAIIGESGAGKTTLGSLLLRLYDLDSGSINYKGMDIKKFTAEETRSIFSTALQGSYLFSNSIRHNFKLLYPHIDEQAIMSALTVAQLMPIIHSLPQGIDTHIGENGVRLSGGERNRLLTALALANNTSPIVLLDEPTAGLNETLSHKLIQSIISELNRRGQTLILITHEKSLLASMKQIVKI